MTSNILIQNERQLSEAQAKAAELSTKIGSSESFREHIAFIPDELVEDVKQTFAIELSETERAIEAFRAAKDGDCSLLFELAGSDLGLKLIAARVCRGLSQKELARKLGLKEQSVQRWETERYKSITIANFQSVSKSLGLSLSMEPLTRERLDWSPSFETSQSEASKVLKHAKARGWIEGADPERLLARRISDHVQKHGTPSLLRTGLNADADVPDWFLIAWKAQVTTAAEKKIGSLKCTFDPLNFAWLPDLVRLSAEKNGAKQAQSLLAEHGIVLIIEPQIPGMKVDGAAFLVEAVPVIGMTLIKNTIDNFWFTLLHELGHVFLHFRTGLASGFFDDVERRDTDEFEKQADRFAENLLVPERVWTRSPARISNTSAPVERLANSLGISPAILFGRIRMERSRYSIFSNKIGQGTIRRQFPEYDGVRS